MVRNLAAGICTECGASVVRDAGRAPLVFSMGVGRVVEDADGNDVLIDPPDEECIPVEVPGLFRCSNCIGKPGNVGPYEALTYLVGTYIPSKQKLLLTLGNLMTAGQRERVKEQANAALDAASTIASFLSLFGQEPDDDGEPCEHWDSPDKIEAVLQTVTLDPEGGITYACPCCDGRHDAAELFERIELFQSFMSDSKD